MSDLTGQFNTQLNALDEQKFQVWLKDTGRRNDLADYDLRGAWKEGAEQAANGHFTDKFKKPNHPTFSDESIYSSKQMPGGKWRKKFDGRWTFAPSQHNIDNYGAENLMRYFQKNEAESILLMPQK